MKKVFLLLPTLFLAVVVNAAIPELTKSAPLTLTAASEGFSSLNTNALDGEWINWDDEFIHEGYAMWRVNILHSGIYAITLDMTCDNTSKFLASVINPVSGDTIDSGNSTQDWAKTDAALSCGSVSLINLEPGEYDIAVTEVVQWSHAKLRGVTLTYLYGERQAPTTTLMPADAVRSQYAQLIHGTVDTLTFARLDHEWEADDAEYTIEGSQFVKWNLKLQGGKYKFTANTFCKQGHNYRIMILNADESSILYTKQENADNAGYDFHNEGADWQVATDVIDLPKGNYVLKMQAKEKGRVMSVEAEYLGGANVNLPAFLMPVDALRSQYAQYYPSTGVGVVDTLTFAPKNAEWYAKDDNYTVAGSQYVKWVMNVDKAGLYKFTANTYCKQGHNYRIILMNEAETDTIVNIQEAVGTGSDYHNEGADWQYGTSVIDLAVGKYVLMMQAKPHGRVMSVIASYEGGAVVNVPGQILAKEAVIGKVDGGHTPKMSHLMESGDLQYNDNGHHMEEFATWTLNVTEAKEMEVTLNVAHSGHIFSLELYQGDNRLDSIGEIFEGDNKTLWKSGDITLPNHMTFPETGTYTLKLINNQQYSTGALHGITFTPYVEPDPLTTIVMNDEATTNNAWVDHVGETVNVKVERTILGGMFNTICLPFKVSEEKCKAVFGSDVKLYTLGSAELSGDILNLQFDEASDIWNGTPILIKTSSTITDPVFNEVLIESDHGDGTYRNAANFKGSFVAQTFHAGDQVLLLLANNKVAYPTQDRTLKGFRAYFQINGGTNAAPIRGARIIAGEQVVTAIDLVETAEGIQKTIENGQLVIIKNGIRYNVMGAQIK